MLKINEDYRFLDFPLIIPSAITYRIRQDLLMRSYQYVPKQEGRNKDKEFSNITFVKELVWLEAMIRLNSCRENTAFWAIFSHFLKTCSEYRLTYPNPILHYKVVVRISCGEVPATMGRVGNCSGQFSFEIARPPLRLDLLTQTSKLYLGSPLRFTCLQLFISY